MSYKWIHVAHDWQQKQNACKVTVPRGSFDRSFSGMCMQNKTKESEKHTTFTCCQNDQVHMLQESDAYIFWEGLKFKKLAWVFVVVLTCGFKIAVSFILRTSDLTQRSAKGSRKQQCISSTVQIGQLVILNWLLVWVWVCGCLYLYVRSVMNWWPYHCWDKLWPCIG